MLQAIFEALKMANPGVFVEDGSKFDHNTPIVLIDLASIQDDTYLTRKYIPKSAQAELPPWKEAGDGSVNMNDYGFTEVDDDFPF